MKTRAEIKEEAKIGVRHQYGIALGVFLIFTAMSWAVPGIGSSCSCRRCWWVTATFR